MCSLEYWAQNSFGEEVHHIAEIKIDKSAPITDDDESGSYVGSAEILLDATDMYSGVAATFWRLDGGIWRTGTTVSCSTVGDHMLEYYSVDNVGIAEVTKQQTFPVTANASPTFTPVQSTDRYKTAVEISKKAFPNGIPSDDYQGYRTCILATGANWPDALGASSLAGALGGPVLLTPTLALPSEVAAEIDRLGADRVIIIGSTSAVSDAVRSAVAAVPGVTRVERLEGGNRYQTATKVASATVDALGEAYDGNAFVSTGLNFPDALGAAPIAAHKGWPVYLMGGSGDVAVAQGMNAHGVEHVYLLGSTNALPASVESVIKSQAGLSADDLDRLQGADRYATAAAVAQFGVDDCGLAWDGVALATGEAFPDALAGGLMQGRLGSVVLLTAPTALSAPAAAKLTANKAMIDEVRYLGSVSAVSTAVRTRVQQIIQ